MRTTAYLALIVLTSLALAGCPGENGSDDAGTRDTPMSGMDTPRTDTPGTDTPGAVDTPRADTPGADVPGADVPGTADVPGAADAPIDAGCMRPICEPLVPGCRYEGATPCDCGTVVCAPSTCEPACAATDYCDQCSPSPMCVVRPEDMGLACPAVYMPVCGCDGRTYSNRCAIGSAGIPIQHAGECVPAPGDCGGAACNRGEYCRYSMGCSGGVASCEPRPDLCPDIFMPVCGCDGNTYGNACEAAAAGVNVEHDGECARPTTCEPPCRAGTTCMPCRGIGGIVYACIPDGAAC